jgi:hypothetical protein
VGAEALCRDEGAALEPAGSKVKKRALAAGKQASQTPSSSLSRDSMRVMYGGRRDETADGDESGRLCFDTDWLVSGREPRARVRLLTAAGWHRVFRSAHGGVGSHHKVRRELPGCRPASQTLTFSTTPGDVRSWQHEAASLARADRDAMAAMRAVGLL